MKTKQTQGQTALSRIIWFIMAAAAVFGLLLGSNARAADLLIADGFFSLSLTAGQELAEMDGVMDCRALYRCLDSAAADGWL
jgi:hypothetical protein